MPRPVLNSVMTRGRPAAATTAAEALMAAKNPSRPGSTAGSVGYKCLQERREGQGRPRWRGGQGRPRSGGWQREGVNDGAAQAEQQRIARLRGPTALHCTHELTKSTGTPPARAHCRNSGIHSSCAVAGPPTCSDASTALMADTVSAGREAGREAGTGRWWQMQGRALGTQVSDRGHDGRQQAPELRSESSQGNRITTSSSRRACRGSGSSGWQPSAAGKGVRTHSCRA